jgi:hypothetical protein
VVMRALFPESLAKLQSKVLQESAARKTPLPFQKRAQVELLLGKPTDAHLTQPVISTLQKSYATHPQPTQRPGTPSSAPASLSITKNLATDFETARR